MSVLKSVTMLTEAPTDILPDSVLTYSDCIAICDRAIASSEKLSSLINVSIVDAGGNALFFYKMPGAWEGSVDIAQSKAYTAFAFSGDKDKQGPLSTEELGKLSQPGKPLYGIQQTNTDKGIVIFGGGIPLYKNNKLVGAVGISGSTVDNDVEICTAAAGKLL